MPLHVRDPKVDRLVRELATSRGIGLTEAIEIAVTNELSRDADVRERVRRLQDRVAAMGESGLKADKEFYDSLNDE